VDGRPCIASSIVFLASANSIYTRTRSQGLYRSEIIKLLLLSLTSPARLRPIVSLVTLCTSIHVMLFYLFSCCAAIANTISNPLYRVKPFCLHRNKKAKTRASPPPKQQRTNFNRLHIYFESQNLHPVGDQLKRHTC
jgi:hypothetical protein